MSRAMATATVQQLASDALVPERQSGFEAGAEWYFPQGSWFRLTAFDQRADNLIQQVPIRNQGAVPGFQFQNLGAIRNRGAEISAGATGGPIALTGILYFTESRIVHIAQRYTGYLVPGDALPEIPETVGSLALRYRAGAVAIEAGGSWLGGWTGFDRAAAVAVEAGQLPSRDTPRDFWIDYPGVLRPWLAASGDIGKRVSVFIRADNPAQATRFIRDNLSPPLGRTTVVGVTIQR
jgi:outer membrane receptor protein involved in Fe transport